MEFKVFDLGLVDFAYACNLQKEIFLKVKSNEFSQALIACQHHPVLSVGRAFGKNSILVNEAELQKRGIGICRVERGGDVTYHGPGQLVIYPIINLAQFKKDIHFFLRCLEGIAIRVLEKINICAFRRAGLTGVWVDDKKIASIGITVKNWITYHGLSINVKSNDLDNFSLIRPCGMDIIMTSVETVLGRGVDVDLVKQLIFQEFFNLNTPGEIREEMLL